MLNRLANVGQELKLLLQKESQMQKVYTFDIHVCRPSILVIIAVVDIKGTNTHDAACFQLRGEQ